MHTRQPHAGHQAFVRELGRVSTTHEALGISKIEQIALMAQMIGQMSCDMPIGEISSTELMQTVAMNIVSGNEGRAAELAIIIAAAKHATSGPN